MINVIIIEGSKKLIEDSKLKEWNEQSYKEQNLKNLQKQFGKKELNIIYLHFDGEGSQKSGEMQNLWKFSEKAHVDLIKNLELYSKASNKIHFIINAHGGIGLPRFELPKIGEEREFIEVSELTKLFNNFSSALEEKGIKHSMEIKVNACHFMAEKESNFLNRNFPPAQLTSFDKISKSTSTASFFTNGLKTEKITSMRGPKSYNFTITTNLKSFAPKMVQAEKSPTQALNSEEWLKKYADKFPLSH